MNATLNASANAVDPTAIRRLIRRGSGGLPEAETPDLPATWVCRSVRHLVASGAILDFQDGNHGALYPRVEEFGNEGVKFLTATQVFDDRVLFETAPRLRSSKATTLRIGFAQPGDVLLTHNATVGRVAVLPDFGEPIILGTSVTYYRTNTKLILPEFLSIAMRGKLWQDQLRSVMEQTTRNQVSITKQVEFSLPIPPVEEQAEIVRRVRSAFNLIDKIEARVAAGTVRADKLVQATLAKAFRGELVPTEAELAEQEGRDYETAEVLLARIKLGAVAPTPRSRRALPAVAAFRTDLFEGMEGSERDGVRGIAADLGVLRRRWTTPSPAALTFEGVIEDAFRKSCDRNSPDRVVADPELHHAFVEHCRKLGLGNPEFDLCFTLLNMRKGNDLKGLNSARRPVTKQWRYAAASEIAARVVQWRHGLTVDRILCHPTFVEEFEQVARSITPGYTSFEYRWAALGCRKVGQKAAQGVVDRLRWSDPVSFAAVGDLPDAKGVYALRDRQYEADCLFVCGTESISESIAAQTNLGSQNLFGEGLWRPDPKRLVWTYAKTSATAADRQGIVNTLVSQWTPILNVPRAA